MFELKAQLLSASNVKRCVHTLSRADAERERGRCARTLNRADTQREIERERERCARAGKETPRTRAAVSFRCIIF